MNLSIIPNYQPNFTAWVFKFKNKSNFLTSGEKLKCEKSNSTGSLNKFKNNLKKYITGYPKRINYTAKHKKAFLKVEKELTGKNTLSGYCHDLGKLIAFTIGLPHDFVQKIHIATAPHHVINGHVKKPIMAIIDWECARYTKPDKPLSAREFYETYYVKQKNMRIPEIEEALIQLGL